MSEKISIHALREEGDTTSRSQHHWSRTFLSTPSARRATLPQVPPGRPGKISIHALREEGDSNVSSVISAGE